MNELYKLMSCGEYIYKGEYTSTYEYTERKYTYIPSDQKYRHPWGFSLPLYTLFVHDVTKPMSMLKKLRIKVNNIEDNMFIWMTFMSACCFGVAFGLIAIVDLVKYFL